MFFRGSFLHNRINDICSRPSSARISTFTSLMCLGNTSLMYHSPVCVRLTTTIRLPFLGCARLALDNWLALIAAGGSLTGVRRTHPRRSKLATTTFKF